MKQSEFKKDSQLGKIYAKGLTSEKICRHICGDNCGKVDLPNTDRWFGIGFIPSCDDEDCDFAVEICEDYTIYIFCTDKKRSEIVGYIMGKLEGFVPNDIFIKRPKTEYDGIILEILEQINK